MNIRTKFLQTFLMVDTKVLLFVDDQKAKVVLKLDILG